MMMTLLLFFKSWISFAFVFAFVHHPPPRTSTEHLLYSPHTIHIYTYPHKIYTIHTQINTYLYISTHTYLYISISHEYFFFRRHIYTYTRMKLLLFLKSWISFAFVFASAERENDAKILRKRENLSLSS